MFTEQPDTLDARATFKNKHKFVKPLGKVPYLSYTDKTFIKSIYINSDVILFKTVNKSP